MLFQYPPLVTGVGSTVACPMPGCDYTLPYTTGEEWEPVRFMLKGHFFYNHMLEVLL